MDNLIRVGGFGINSEKAQPLELHSKYQNKKVAGMEINIVVRGSSAVASIEALHGKDTEVYDPFVDRTYQGHFHIATSSYTQGYPDHTYRILIREVEEPPMFEQLEINDATYTVLRTIYISSSTSVETPAFRSVLKLSKEQFEHLAQLRDPQILNNVSVQRIGIDAEPFVTALTKQFWSKHEAGGETFYKRVVLVKPHSDKDETVSRAESEALKAQDLIVTHLIRFEALINDLAAAKIISEERKAELLSDESDSLLPQERIDEIVMLPTQVDDADESLPE